MAEAILRRLAHGAFEVYSAGRAPVQNVSAHALETLKQAGYPTDHLQPKSWNDFVTFSAPNLDVVVTLDEGLKKGPFPIWYSNPVYVHWPFDDPDKAQGDEARQEAYRRLYGTLEQQMLKLAGQDLATLSGGTLKARLQAIAHAS